MLTDLLAEGDALLDKERGDILPDGVQDFAILAEKTAFDFLAYLFLHPVEQSSGLDALIQVGDQLGVRMAERLMRLRAADDFEKVIVHFFRLFFECLLRYGVDVLQRHVFVCRNFTARFVLG